MAHYFAMVSAWEGALRRLRLSHVLPASVAAVLCCASPAAPSLYLVAPDGTGDFPTIRAAISASAEGDTIELTDGIFIGPDNRNLDFAGKNLLLRSQSNNPEDCIIDCRRAGRAFVFHSGEDSTAIVRGITIANGGWNPGGGMTCSGGSAPTIENCIFSGNQASSCGAVECSQSSPTFVQCTFSNNEAVSGDVGDAGAVCCGAGSTVKFIDCTFRDNAARCIMGCGFGGAVEVRESVGIFSHCTFTGNFAPYGGALAAECYSTIQLSGCEFVGNTAGAGGALFCEDTYATAENCIFLDNHGYSGGAASIGWSTLTFVGCTVAEDSADYGGAFELYESSPEFTSCTLAYDSSSSGGAFYCRAGSVPTMTHSIIAFCSGSETFRCDDSSGVAATCCDVYGNEGGDWVGCLAGQEGIEGNFSADPRFCDPESDDFTLENGSPCLPESNPECGLIGAWPAGCSSDVPEISPHASTLLMGPAIPNPFISTVNVVYSLAHGRAGSGKATLRVYDAAGRLVRTLAAPGLSAGSHSISWDGSDEAGRPADAGIYWLRLNVDDLESARNVLRVR